GAQDILRCLPHEYISAKKLPQVAKTESTKRIYICVVTRDDHLRRIDGKYSEKFNVADYEAHSDQYESAFA
uniref:Uncharacterized protein n=1 Tax=Plectus sambesii TaxID=2011161 RepID=A0A914VL75_9BILA